MMGAATVDAFVLDASIAGAWLLPEETSEAADRLFADLRASLLTPHAPDLWWWECSNLIANAVSHARLSPDDALLAWSALDAIRTRVDLATLQPAQSRACLALAVDTGLSSYQAAYLWLAMSLKLPLLTQDTRLAQAASQRNVQVLHLQDLS
jgi:predicted nucleic acid-binding protein